MEPASWHGVWEVADPVGAHALGEVQIRSNVCALRGRAAGDREVSLARPGRRRQSRLALMERGTWTSTCPPSTEIAVSGKSGTPCARMQEAYRTPLCLADDCPLAPLVDVFVVPTFATPGLEPPQPATRRVTPASVASARRLRSWSVTVSSGASSCIPRVDAHVASAARDSKSAVTTRLRALTRSSAHCRVAQ